MASRIVRGGVSMIALQVAAGIVLAYVIIVNQRAILRVARQLSAMVMGIVGFVALGWFAYSLSSAATSRWPVMSSKIGTALGASFVFGLFLAGGYGLILIARTVFKTHRPILEGDGKGPVAIVAGFALLNVLLVYALSWPILAFTPAGNWFDAADRWSRLNGHADAASMLITGVACLWPLPIMWLLKHFRATPAADDRPDPASLQLPSV